MDDGEKTCAECGRALPLLDFPKRSSSADGHHPWCFECKRAKDRQYAAVYRDGHREEYRRRQRAYARTDSVRAKRSSASMWAKYGLTPETFAEKLAAQGGHCPFCPPGSVPKIWDIDHDHRCCPGKWSCGKCLREILCHRHNQGLGMWDDDPAKLRAAADYIERWSEARMLNTAPPRTRAAKRGEGHQGWKGDAALPGAKRLRNYRARGSALLCVNRETASCTSERYEWVLTPGADPGDPHSWTSLCASCRMKLHGYAGGGHFNARLTDEQADQLRMRYAAGGISQKALAAEYGISQPTVSEIVRSVSYKTVLT